MKGTDIASIATNMLLIYLEYVQRYGSILRRSQAGENVTQAELDQAEIDASMALLNARAESARRRAEIEAAGD